MRHLSLNKIQTHGWNGSQKLIIQIGVVVVQFIIKDSLLILPSHHLIHLLNHLLHHLLHHQHQVEFHPLYLQVCQAELQVIPLQQLHISTAVKIRLLVKNQKGLVYLKKRNCLDHVSQRNIINTIAPNTEIKGRVLLIKTMEDFANSTMACVLMCALITRKNTVLSLEIQRIIWGCVSIQRTVIHASDANPRLYVAEFLVIYSSTRCNMMHVFSSKLWSCSKK